MIKITKEDAKKLRHFITHLGNIPHADLMKVKEYSELLTYAIEAPEQESHRAAFSAGFIEGEKAAIATQARELTDAEIDAIAKATDKALQRDEIYDTWSRRFARAVLAARGAI